MEKGRSTPAQSVPGPEVRTFLIADVRGYTSFTVEHGDEAAARLTARFADLVEEVVTARDGAVIELRGDEALAVFTSARQALRAAAELQTRLDREMRSDPSLPLKVGVGLDAGEAIPVKGGYRGAALNMAARLCALAGPGEVLASDGVIHLARKVDGLTYVERGMAQLKGFADPIRVLSITHSPPEPSDRGDTGRQRSGESGMAAESTSPTSTPEGTAGGRSETPPLPIGGFLGSLPDSVLVGREEELRRVMTSVDTAAGGAGRLVLMVGEPGVGKTRLAQEVTLHLRNRGFLLAAGRCYDTHQHVPFYPFLDALAVLYRDAPARIRADVPRRWPYLARLLPEQNMAGLQPVIEESGDQERLFWAVGGFINAIAEETGVAVLIDDLHWADAASLDLILHLARQTRARRVLLLGTYRDVEINRKHPLARALRDLSREHLAEEVAVRRLDRAGTAALMSVTVGEQERSDALVDLVYRRTEGNPFFTHEVLRTLIECGDVFQEGGRWDERSLGEIEIPRSVRDAVGERLTRLSEPAQEVLQEASVLGQTFNFDDLRSMVGIGERELEDILDEVVEAQLVRDADHDTYVFDHALTQHTLYEELSSRRKRRLHRDAAEALERLPERQRAKRATEIAWHFQHADDSGRALPYTLSAGDQAEAVFAHREAERHYRTALELAEDVGDASQEAAAAEKLGRVLQATARFAEALDLFERAISIYRSAGNQDGEARTAVQVAWILFVRGENRNVIARVRPLLGTLERGPLSRPLAELYLVFASALTGEGNVDEALELAERAREIARELGDDALIAAAEGRRGLALMAAGNTQEARPALERTITLAEAAGDLDTQLLALANLVSLGGNRDSMIAFIRRALSAVEQTNDPVWLADVIRMMIQSGYTEEARGHLERALALAREAGVSEASLYPLLQLLGTAARTMGEWETSRRYLDQARILAEQAGFPWPRWMAMSELAWQDIWEGKPEDALALLEPERDAMDEWGLFPAGVRAEAYLQLGDHEKAEQVVTQILRLHGDHGWRGKIMVLRVRGMVFSRQRRWDEAARSFDEALALAPALNVAEFEAHTLYEYGLMYLEKGDPERAGERLEEALSTFERIGAKPFAERTRQALKRLS